MDSFDLNSSEYEVSPLPKNPVVAMAYIPYQNPKNVYSAEQGINSGTMFPCLDKPFIGCGGDELAHLEMIGVIVYQLTRNLTPEQIKEAGFDAYFVDHTTGVYPSSSSGTPFTAAYLQVKGDPITDLHEDLAAEQKARSTYKNILRFCDDPDVKDPIRFLRAREIVHYQRFGEAISAD